LDNLHFFVKFFAKFNSNLHICQVINEVLSIFNIQRSLSMKVCPYDNAVVESTFKAFKTEFVCGGDFVNWQQLKLEISDYVHWFNYIRIRGLLNYLIPVQVKLQPL